MHLVAPGSWKYFGRAIMQSGNSQNKNEKNNLQTIKYEQKFELNSSWTMRKVIICFFLKNQEALVEHFVLIYSLRKMD